MTAGAHRRDDTDDLSASIERPLRNEHLRCALRHYTTHTAPALNIGSPDRRELRPDDKHPTEEPEGGTSRPGREQPAGTPISPALLARLVTLMNVNDDFVRRCDDETAYWLSRPDILESIREADADIAAGRLFDEEDIRAEFCIQRWP